MRNRILVATGAILSAVLLASPARGWQVNGDEHATHHPESPSATTVAPPASAKLDELVKKMNAAKGQAKVDAMAELLTALVQTHQSMHADMSTMMRNMGEMHRK